MTDQPTRIVRLITELEISGTALQAILLAARLDETTYEGWLVCGGEGSDDDDNLQTIAQEYGVVPQPLSSLGRSLNPLQHLRAVWQLYRFFKDIQPHIVHTHSMSAGFSGRIAARLAGVPVVVHTLHEYPFRGYYDHLRTLLFIYLERFGARLSDSIITLSEGLRAELSDRYHITGRNRLTVLPLGFDLTSFAQAARHRGTFRAAWQIPADAPLVGIIGRLLPVKNHALFLDAAARVHEQLPQARFVVVGDGELREGLESKAQALGLGEAVIFTGWQSHMEPIYSDLDVLVNSSWNEGTPVPIIEALAAGCPVVATDVGGIPDLLDNGAFGALVPSSDVTALADAITRTLHNPPDTTAAQQTMLRRYDISRLAAELDSLYRGLLAKKRQ